MAKWTEQQRKRFSATMKEKSRALHQLKKGETVGVSPASNRKFSSREELDELVAFILAVWRQL